jgi:FkbM family methyltransferase
MIRRRKWMAEVLLRAPTPLRSLRAVPVLGSIIHRFSHQILPPDEIVWKQVEGGPAKGIWLELNPRTGPTYLRGDMETPIQKIVAERLHPDMVFYDLGANIGLFTLLASRLVGPKGKVFSFEPDDFVASRLRRNVARNGFDNITVIEAGVWSKSGTVNFIPADHVISPDHGLGRFVTGEQASAGTPKESVALDDFIKTNPPPDAIKCDVEGAEVEVFRGAEGLLKAHRPWIICETHSPENDTAFRAHLTALGYHLDAADGNHILATP